MPKVKVGDINMYYELHGQGEPLVFIVGFGANISASFLDIPAFSDKYKIIVFDNRGAGRSDAPAIPYTMEMMADDLAGLLDTIDIYSAHIMGISMGGMISQEFALRHPESVKSLILACTYCGGPGSSIITSSEMIQRMADLPPKEGLMEIMRLCITQKYIDENPGLLEQIVEQMMKHPISPHGQMRQSEAVLGHNTYERLPKIKATTLVIHGDADRVIPVENANILASRIPGAEIVIFPNTGHMLLEAGNEMNQITLDFLRRHRTEKA
jgi:pimeloyl-ACP methyl ester carboxylesterase